MKRTKSELKNKPNFQKRYYETVIPETKAEFKLENSLEVPKLEKIVVNVGIGSISQEDFIKKIWNDLRKVTGQNPVYTLARKAISGFKVRQGQKVGIKVTLRGKRMWEFLERLTVATLPRIKDFQGIAAKNFNERGNCSIGIKEHIVFPEINPDEIDYSFGLEVCIVINGNSREEGMFILKKLGFPVRENDK